MLTTKTLAHFQIEGKVRLLVDLFNSNVIDGVISSVASFNSRALILASPVALLAFRDLCWEATKSSSTGRMRKLVVSFDCR